MKSIPLSQRYIGGLTALGYTELKPTAHFRVFHKSSLWVYIGVSGAVRYNRSGKVSNTRATSQGFKDSLLAANPGPTHTHYGRPAIHAPVGDIDFDFEP